MKKKNLNNNINQNDSMINISYEILKSNGNEMPIYDLIYRVLEIKQIDKEDINKISQLYLDIVSSGRFVFCGNDLWNIKNNNVHLWDKEYFADDKTENQIINSNNKIPELKDFKLENYEIDGISKEEELETNIEDLDFNINDDNLDHDIIDEQLNDEEEIKDKEENTDEEELMHDYQYFYENIK
ncbi:MAG: DNA-directed RNA polymerase subunit delta [Vigna little leaf phytoplasma]|nr:DNA-directed RNA polymerase subunit delta [Vigna little leaf phytoplasma]